MTFQYPYAFFALLAIPVLILIYILRNKYKETTAPSTYLWEISQKFMKKRNPFHSIERLLALIIQCFTVCMLAVCLAHPVLTFKNGTDNIVFVLDSSASMRIKNADKTRFDVAKEEIMKTVKDSKKGTSFSLVTSDKESKIVCEGITDIDQFQMYVDSVSCSYSTTELKDSIAQAQKLISNGSASICYLATDKTLLENNYQNIKMLDCSDDQVNYAVTAVSYDDTISVDTLNLQYTLTAYDKAMQERNEGKSAEAAERISLKIRVYVNGESKAVTISDVIPGFDATYDCGIPDKQSLGEISSVTITIDNKDALDDDNSMTVYNNDTIVTTNVMLVSNTPNYFKSVFKALKNINVKTVSTSRYNPDDAHGYDIYVFEGYMPETVPNDGALWFFDVGENSNKDCGFTYSATRVDDTNGFTLEYAQNDESILYSEITKNLVKRDVLVSEYNRYSITGNFTTILSYNNTPVIFVGKNNRQQREVVCGFSLQKSDFAVTYDFVSFMRNSVNYSNPRLLTQFNYEIDSSALLSIPDTVTSIKVKRPDGHEIQVSVNETGYVSYVFDQVGSYEISTVTDNNTDKTIRCFVSYPKEESDPSVVDTNAYNVVLNENPVKGDSIFDSILPVVIAASILFGLDWILYAHEQY